MRMCVCVCVCVCASASLPHLFKSRATVHATVRAQRRRRLSDPCQGNLYNNIRGSFSLYLGLSVVFDFTIRFPLFSVKSMYDNDLM